MMNDLISRQMAIDAAIGWLKDRLTDRKNGESLIDRLKHLPSAQQWIPCSKRLPKNHDWYWVTFKMVYHGKEFCGTDVIEYCPHEIYMGDGEYDIEPEWCFNPNEDKEVIAWMPLPEPYKENKNETD